MVKKLLLGLSFLAFSTNAYAVTDDELIQKCLEVGTEKIKLQAMIFECELISPVEASGIDNRWYNPFKYVWYAADVKCADGSAYEIEKLTQYSKGECY
jgi:hypothetical protein